MTKKIAALGLSAMLMSSSGFAAEGPTPGGVPRFDHIFMIMMENHGFYQISGNPNAPSSTITKTPGAPRSITLPSPIPA
jgi:hypothetical protein